MSYVRMYVCMSVNIKNSRTAAPTIIAFGVQVRYSIEMRNCSNQLVSVKNIQIRCKKGKISQNAKTQEPLARSA